jgi:hypothetical protein
MQEQLNLQQVQTMQPDATLPEPYRARKIDREQVVELRSKGLSMSQIGTIVNADKSSICRILQDYDYDDARVDAHNKHRAEILANLQAKLLISINNDDIKAMAPRDRVVAYGILYDKMRLEMGLSTNNIDAHLMLRNDQTIDSKLSELQAMVDSL